MDLSFPGDTYQAEDGTWLCGADFMAGTICSLLVGHEGGHGTDCHVCGIDWYTEGHCACYQPDVEEE